MPLATGCQHIALVTADLDRFSAFYERVFEAEILYDMTEDGMRHAFVHLGGGLCLHAFELGAQHPAAAGLPRIFERGHLDHFAVEVADRETLDVVRRRLVAEGACDGTLTDFGFVGVVSFTDPDGMEAEVALRGEGAPLTFNERRRIPFEG